MDTVRCDKWLWAARFFKTRALAQQAIEKGRVLIGGERIKPARTLKVGDLVSLDQGDWMREITIRALSDTRGPAPVAQTLYADTAVSLAARDKAREQRIYSPDPAASIKGRPSKRDRRALERTRGSD